MEKQFRTTIDKQYVGMLAQRSNTTLADDGYRAYNAIANEETAPPSKNTIQYTKRLAMVDAVVSKLGEGINIISLNP